MLLPEFQGDAGLRSGGCEVCHESWRYRLMSLLDTRPFVRTDGLVQSQSTLWKLQFAEGQRRTRSRVFPGRTETGKPFLKIDREAKGIEHLHLVIPRFSCFPKALCAVAIWAS